MVSPLLDSLCGPMSLRAVKLSAKKEEDATPAVERRGFWRSSLFLVTSMALGGIAVAIWNRRTLALLRQHEETPGGPGAED